MNLVIDDKAKGGPCIRCHYGSDDQYGYGPDVIRGTRKLNGGQFYWEIKRDAHMALRPPSRRYIMGICSGKRSNDEVKATLYGDGVESSFDSWGITNVVWHGGIFSFRNFKRDGFFRVTSVPTKAAVVDVIGVYFDGLAGTLSLYVNGECLGDVFTGLDQVQEPIYPMFFTDFTCVPPCGRCTLQLTVRKKSFPSLQYLCRNVIADNLRCREDAVVLPLPSEMKEYVLQYLTNYYDYRNDQSNSVDENNNIDK